MDVTVYERDRGFVLGKLREGEFDYVDTCDEVFETDFLRYVGARGILKKLAETYPTPRKKTEVPVWVCLASSLSMRLHGVEAFHQYNYVIRTGGLMNAFGPELGSKVPDPKTDDIKLACDGFNRKNHYQRETPCNQDFLRKFYRDTETGRAEHWYNTDVARILKKRHAYDKRGLFIGDGSYLFVPDNPKYEGSAKLLFDKHNHPVDPKGLTQAEVAARGYRWRRCYKVVNLLHVRPELDCFLMVGFRLLSGKQSELPPLYDLVDTFVDAVGPGVIKRLILDRGFLDGERIGHLKLDHGIDVLIPVRRNMDIYADAMGLVGQVKFREYRPPDPPSEQDEPPAPKPEAVAKREASRQRTLDKKRAEQPPLPPDEQLVAQEVGALAQFRSWSSCPVPLSAVYCRDTFADGHRHEWILLDTKTVDDPGAVRAEYRIRTQIEERYRQLKCFTDLTAFTSRKLSLVLHQIMTVLLTYTLLQLYLMRQKRKELSRKPIAYARKQLLPSASWIVVYCQGKVAFFDGLEYTEIIATLDDEPRAKVAKRARRLRRERAIMSDGRRPRGP